MALIKFVRNYKDESTETGFQFKFHCDRCGTGYLTSFQASATGMVSEALDVASGLLGGVFGKAARVGDRIHSSAWERAHDKAFAKAVEEIKPKFTQCPRCTHWVCRESCWNEERGLCKDCAPDLTTEYAAEQVKTELEQGRKIIRKTEYVADEGQFKTALRAACPKCGAAVSGGKFCPECGAALSEDKFCIECGSKVSPKAKFCPECGAEQP
ncbi:MAG: zinc ribbon domain-containing protein [Anaerolineaceae bacterium 4572_32.1]|nr:MAG: zinc ribbon domain-containing protein [Anaerolineaceae bacterium 4572_32.1]